jgi:hypothetical protein
MCSILRVRWTITPRIAPQPWIACSGCGSSRAFLSSGRIRLNANGKRLDAWLIYRCLSCEKTWNRPLFERRHVRDIDQAMLDALHANDPDWIRTQEFDIDALGRRAQQVAEFVDVDISKEVLNEPGVSATALEIELLVPLSTSLRLDRLLTTELRLPRSRLNALYEEGRLRIDPDRKDVLRRRIKHGTRINLDFSEEADLRSRWAAANGTA